MLSYTFDKKKRHLALSALAVTSLTAFTLGITGNSIDVQANENSSISVPASAADSMEGIIRTSMQERQAWGDIHNKMQGSDKVSYFLNHVKGTDIQATYNTPYTYIVPQHEVDANEAFAQKHSVSGFVDLDALEIGKEYHTETMDGTLTTVLRFGPDKDDVIINGQNVREIINGDNGLVLIIDSPIAS